MHSVLRSFLVRFAFVLLPAVIFAGAAPAHAGGPISVFFDLRPAECPNRLYAGANRGGLLLPAAVLGTGDLDTANIVASSLLLVVPGGGGYGEIVIPPISTAPADVATPVLDPSNCNCTFAGPDVLVDLTMDFDAGAVIDALELINPDNVSPGFEFPLCIRGSLADGSTFFGCDCVLIDAPPVAVDAQSWGRVKSGYR
jgi:hypothetical protein